MLILRPNKINSLKLFKVACLCFERTTAYPLGGPGNATPSGGRDGVPASEIFVREIQPVTCTSEKKIWMGKKSIAEKLDSLLLASSKLLDRTIDKEVRGRFHFISFVLVASSLSNNIYLHLPYLVSIRISR